MLQNIKNFIGTWTYDICKLVAKNKAVTSAIVVLDIFVITDIFYYNISLFYVILLFAVQWLVLHRIAVGNRYQRLQRVTDNACPEQCNFVRNATIFLLSLSNKCPIGFKLDDLVGKYSVQGTFVQEPFLLPSQRLLYALHRCPVGTPTHGLSFICPQIFAWYLARSTDTPANQWHHKFTPNFHILKGISSMKPLHIHSRA
ncbi:hypothetical protein TNIN_147411 [Trichonephila inaurata madagascariensis]|uniref:Uncharacterized protein n=1 Tax=Trichonephila inaurata madagascariensis TaxID=2747483 RepID=A0A8X6YTJ2_9ARAC|nr:hypothetical protein TNIN_147411 [Trichonephila inaurata madagascariensis]